MVIKKLERTSMGSALGWTLGLLLVGCAVTAAVAKAWKFSTGLFWTGVGWVKAGLLFGAGTTAVAMIGDGVCLGYRKWKKSREVLHAAAFFSGIAAQEFGRSRGNTGVSHIVVESLGSQHEITFGVVPDPTISDVEWHVLAPQLMKKLLSTPRGRAALNPLVAGLRAELSSGNEMVLQSIEEYAKSQAHFAFGFMTKLVLHIFTLGKFFANWNTKVWPDVAKIKNDQKEFDAWAFAQIASNFLWVVDVLKPRFPAPELPEAIGKTEEDTKWARQTPPDDEPPPQSPPPAAPLMLPAPGERIIEEYIEITTPEKETPISVEELRHAASEVWEDIKISLHTYNEGWHQPEFFLKKVEFELSELAHLVPDSFGAFQTLAEIQSYKMRLPLFEEAFETILDGMPPEEYPRWMARAWAATIDTPDWDLQGASLTVEVFKAYAARYFVREVREQVDVSDDHIDHRQLNEEEVVSLPPSAAIKLNADQDLKRVSSPIPSPSPSVPSPATVTMEF